MRDASNVVENKDKLLTDIKNSWNKLRGKDFYTLSKRFNV